MGNVSNDSDSQSTPIQTMFLNTLPSDIILAIFLYLDQQDCLTCMRVCQAWYGCVPQYAQGVWKTVRFSAIDARTDNRLREKCLGKHVKTMVFDTFELEDDLYRMMNKVIGWDCTELETLELKNCTTADQDTFLLLLKQLAAQRMTCLKMAQHNSNVAFLHLFGVCPKLTHFTYEATEEAYVDHNVYSVEPMVCESTTLPATECKSLVYLCLDAALHGRLRLIPILKKCPNLEYLLGLSSTTYISVQMSFPRHYNACAIPLDTVFIWCPKITHIATNNAWFNLSDEEEMVKAEKCPGLCHFAVCEASDHSVTEISPHLLQNQQTLKHLSINAYPYFASKGDWSSVFRSLHLFQLRTLECYEIQFDIASLIAILNQCPRLDTLILRRIPLIFDESSVRQLRRIPRLRKLDLEGGTFDDEFRLTTLFERFPALETLQLSRVSTTLDLDAVMEHLKQLKYLELIDINRLKCNQPMTELTAAARQSKIQVVNLDSVPNVSDKLLQVFAHAPALRSLRARLEPNLCSEDGLTKFATLLRNTVIENLNIYHVRCMSYTMLDALGNLPHLTNIVVTNPSLGNSPAFGRMFFLHPPTQVDKDGLVQMLRCSKSLEYLYSPKIAIIASNGKAIDFDAAIALLQQELPQYTIQAVMDDNKVVLPRLNPIELQKVLCSVSINRVDNT
ncbi:hypothetical protein BJV82DRAFT_624048 [Fennellomyces sp. T-0311]|nr:hypothetical protein BJV82DRAFT_624048 [Fennellomyces sp. T-0311]